MVAEGGQDISVDVHRAQQMVVTRMKMYSKPFKPVVEVESI